LIHKEKKNIAKIFTTILNEIINEKGLPGTTDWDYEMRDQLSLPREGWKDLSSADYQMMEADKSKYKLYAEALTKIIIQQMKKKEEEITIYVLGAGRSGLVQICMDVVKCSVQEHLRNHVSIVAIEKNAHAVISLNHYNEIL
jgi:hypothetical protein